MNYDRVDTSQQFLDLLFPDLTDSGLRLLIWTPRISWWHSRTEDAVQTVQTLTRQQKNVYHGCGLAERNHGRHKRAKANDVAAITSLWGDFDYQGAAHKKPNLPPTKEAAWKLAFSVKEAPPSLIVHSGHGWQPYWLLYKPWVFEDAQDRIRAEHLLEDWQEMFRRLSAQHGWTLDSTHDLPRVLRTPGSRNWKDPAKPVDVTLLIGGRDNPRRYTVKYLETIAKRFLSMPMASSPRGDGRRKRKKPQSEAHRKPTGSELQSHIRVVSGLKIDPQAKPNTALFEALYDNKPTFAATWDKQRGDLPDGTPSSYDFSLASHAVAAGWPDQEICNLVIAWRRKHFPPGSAEHEKFLDPFRRYIERNVIPKARANWAARRARDEAKI